MSPRRSLSRWRKIRQANESIKVAGENDRAADARRTGRGHAKGFA